jgi:hypothetical protein
MKPSRKVDQAKEIQPAWVEVPRRPYLRLFEEGADDDA